MTALVVLDWDRNAFDDIGYTIAKYLPMMLMRAIMMLMITIMMIMMLMMTTRQMFPTVIIIR